MNRLGLSSKVVQDRPLCEAVEIAARCGYAGNVTINFDPSNMYYAGEDIDPD